MSEQSTRVATLFAQALNVPRSDRAAFLDEHCTDEACRAEVSSLLDAHEEASSFFNELRTSVPAPTLGTSEETAPGTSEQAEGTARSTHSTVQVGTRIDKYIVQELVGEGGMGIVYRAWDPQLERSVALKFLPPALAAVPEVEERFVQEARAAARVEHPNVATIHEIGETEEGVRFIAMTHYDGHTLRTRMARDGPFEAALAVEYTRTVAEALHEVHRVGIVHRDVKPENVMVTEQGTLKLLDFGLAKAAATGLSGAGRRLGTPSYMSPEQAEGGETGPRADVWALGVMLYEMLTGERPFSGAQSQDVLRAVREVEPVPVDSRTPDIPSPLPSIVAKCLAKDPVERYASARALADELEALDAGGSAEHARAIAVLPFVARGEQEAGALTGGLHESILARLSNVADLKVTVGTSADRGDEEGLSAVAEELGVRWILRGSVWRADDRIRIGARLVDAQADATVWAETYRRDLTAENLFDVQEEITREIAEALTAEVTAGEQERISDTPTENLSAYRLYVQGRTTLGRRDKEGVASAVTYFRRAVEEDPGYALAWSGLADALALRPVYVPESIDTVEIGPEEAARRALELSPDLAEGHASMGYLQAPPAGTRRLRHAIELKSSYAQAHAWLAHELIVGGELEEARAHSEFAADLVPHSRATQGFVAFVDIAEEAYPSGLTKLEELVDPGRENEPEWVLEMGARYQFAALYGLNRWDAARALAERRLSGTALEKWHAGWTAKLGLIDAVQGNVEAARHRLARLQGHEGALFRGLLYAALGEEENAFSSFEAVETWGYTDMVELRHFYPTFLDPLRKQDRFERLLATVEQRRAANPTAAYQAHAGSGRPDR